jgi:hypothetical protein
MGYIWVFFKGNRSLLTYKNGYKTDTNGYMFFESQGGGEKIFVKN